ncbi:MAG: sigma 54-interacting transcriptional regulator [Thermoanaerobaculia bacterium]|nr:sigma 54-interacting transcriptional regulator [Thermoanaerobaculia bacterium]
MTRREASSPWPLEDNGIPLPSADITPAWDDLERQLGPLAERRLLAVTAGSVLWGVSSPTHPNRALALKVGRGASGAEELARFRLEARLLAEVHHPHVIEVLEAGVLPGALTYLLMERVVERPVRSLFAAGFDPAVLRELAAGLAAGLGHIHRHGLVHLDVKPDNLGFVTGDERRVVLLDFGLATERAAEGEHGRIRGTLAYTAPEVLLQDRYDHRADFYSLGLTLFELATGVLPSAGGNAEAVLFHLHGELPDPRRWRPELPEDLVAVMQRLTRREPERRFADAGQLLAALGQDTSPAGIAGRWLGSGAVLASRLVGRDPLLAKLRVGLEQAAAGHGRAVVLSGPAGVGKARILREFRRLAAAEGAIVGWSGPRSALSGSLDAVAEALARVGVTWPAFGEREPADRFRLYDEVAGRLTARAGTASGPLVILLQDLDEAGPEALALLGDLARATSAARVLLVASVRPRLGLDDDPEEPLETLEVPPLGAADLRAVIDASLALEGEVGLPSEIYEWLERASQGSPGRVQRGLRELLDARVLRFDQGRWRHDTSELARLTGERAAIDRGRIDRLRPQARELLEALAVAGGAHELERIAGWLGRDSSEVFADLEVLTAGGLAERFSEQDGGRWTVADGALAEEVLAGLAAGRRQMLDRRLAREYAERSRRGDPAAAAAAAEHGWRAGDRVDSLPFLFTAGEWAEALFAHGEAARLFGRAREAAEELGDGAAALRARIAEARAKASAGDALGALARYEEALRAAGAEAPRLRLEAGRLRGRLGEPEAALAEFEWGLTALAAGAPDLDLELELRHGVAVALRDAGRPVEAFVAARSALRRLGPRGHARQRALLWNTLARLAAARGEGRRAERLARRGLRVAEIGGEPAAVIVLTNTLAIERWRRGDLPGAAGLFAQVLAACRATQDVWGEQTALNNLGILEASQGHWRQSRELLGPSLELARRLRQRPAEALASLNLAEVEEVLGDFGRAGALLERAQFLLAGAPAEDVDRIAALTRGSSLARKRGQTVRAETLARDALAGALGNADTDLRALARGELALALAARLQPDAAQRELALALGEAQVAGHPQCLGTLLLTAAELALEVADPATARQRLAEARRLVEPLGDRRAEGRLLMLEGLAAVNPAAAEDAFDRAGQLFAAAGAAHDAARAQFAHGLATASPARARERLAAAAQRLEEMGASQDAARARGAWMRLVASTGTSGDPTLPEVVRVINSSLDLQEVLDRTMDLALERLRAEHGMIVLEDPLTRELEVAAARNLGSAATPGVPPDEGRQLSESVVRRVLDKNEPILAVDAVVDSRFVGAESIAASHILSILCVPLAIRNRLVGAIYVDHRKSRHVFTPEDLEFLVAFADGAAIAIDNARLYGEIERSRRQLQAENELLRREMLATHRLGALVGKSRSVLELKSTLERIAGSASTVLVRGESGTGKGLVARTLHGVSSRRDGPYVAFNCAALPETLIESELFGHEKGAFTGAVQRKLGRFELAHGGTIFLDEIGKVSLGVQAKLLRVVEDKEFERVGGTQTVKVDVRIVTATNLDLEEAIRRDTFREDLYYRLNIIPIVLPPLRERREDIPYLVQHFLTKIARDLGQRPKELDPAVLDLFLRHRWPGNVRELEAAIHRALVLGTGDRLTLDDFAWIAAQNGAGPPRPVPPPVAGSSGLAYEEELDRLDRQLVTAALERCGGRIRETARELGLARNTLKGKMKRFGLRGE